MFSQTLHYIDAPFDKDRTDEENKNLVLKARDFLKELQNKYLSKFDAKIVLVNSKHELGDYPSFEVKGKMQLEDNDEFWDNINILEDKYLKRFEDCI